METVTIRDGLWYAAKAPVHRRAAFLMLLLLGLILMPLSAAIARHQITLLVNGESRVISTFSRDVAAVLRETGVSLSRDDLLSHRLDEPVTRGMIIEVTTSFPVAVLADGDELVTRVVYATVADVLSEQGIRLSELDRVKPAPDHQLEPGDSVKVTRVYRHYVTARIEAPFREIRRGNPQLDRGETKVIQRGISGLREDTKKITLEDGREISRAIVQSETIRTKQDRIIEYGENTLLSRGGRNMPFTSVLTVIATAYCPGTEGSGCPIDENGASQCTGYHNDGITASGLPAVAGSGRENDPHLVAVDPRVIPLGSRLYIDGYGFALAADVGSAIVGKRIDILFSEHDTAWLFGRRSLRVYMLR